MTSKEIAKLYGAQCIITTAPMFIDRNQLTVKRLNAEIDGFNEAIDSWSDEQVENLTMGEIQELVTHTIMGIES